LPILKPQRSATLVVLTGMNSSVCVRFSEDRACARASALSPARVSYDRTDPLAGTSMNWLA
jgi:hypothetical protein